MIKLLIKDLERDGLAAMKPKEATLLIAAKETILGTLIFRGEGKVYFWGMYISPDYQRQGIGHLLMNTLVKISPENTTLNAAVLKDQTKARNFYKKCGFIETSEIDHELPDQQITRMLTIERKLIQK